VQLPDSQVDSYFLDIFGRPERAVTSASERMQDPTLTQALHAINGNTLLRKLEARSGLVASLSKDGAPDETVIDRLYLAALSRRPSPVERTKLTAALAAAGDGPSRRAAIEDLTWAVLTSREFLFNH
jgi:hypothetical protein